jgi:hypothetical protein
MRSTGALPVSNTLIKDLDHQKTSSKTLFTKNKILHCQKLEIQTKILPFGID